MIWGKTEAGRLEMQARALVKERARRNLLLLIDGVKTDDMLLECLAGISASDFLVLQELGLIAPVAAPTTGRSSRAAMHPTAPAAPAAPLNSTEFTAALTQTISSELGLLGYVLSLAVEKASTIEELRAVADRTLAQIAERKGEARAAAVRRMLYGG